MTDKMKVVILCNMRREYTKQPCAIGIRAYLCQLFGRLVFNLGRFDSNSEYFLLFDTGKPC